MKYLTLKEYEDVAKKILYESYPKMANSIVCDQDKLGNIITAIITADWKFDGRGTIYGYRKQYLKWTLCKLFKNIIPESQCGEGYLIPCRESYNLVDEQDSKEFLKRTIENSTLNSKEKKYTMNYMIDEIPLKEIATKYNTSTNTIRNNVREGLNKLGIFNKYVEGFKNRQRRRRTSKANS